MMQGESASERACGLFSRSDEDGRDPRTPDSKRSNRAGDGDSKPSHDLEKKSVEHPQNQRLSRPPAAYPFNTYLTEIQGTVEDHANFTHGPRDETSGSCKPLGSARPFHLHVGVAEITSTAWELARIHYSDRDGSGPRVGSAWKLDILKCSLPALSQPSDGDPLPSRGFMLALNWRATEWRVPRAMCAQDASHRGKWLRIPVLPPHVLNTRKD